MEVTFRNAPLVEVLVELRWQPTQLGIVPVPQAIGLQSQPSAVIGTTELEHFYTDFANVIAKHGFVRSERLIPTGAPAIQGQAVVRFRSSSPDKTGVLYQVGPGMFSANAVPPYRSWKNFFPEVEAGLNVLLSSRRADNAKPFNPTSLRYINAFRPELMQGRDSADFISTVLKFGVDLPEAVLKHRAPSKSLQEFIGIVVPVTAGVLRLNVGEAIVAGIGKAVLLDMTLSSEDTIEPIKDLLVERLNSAHSVLHEMFLELTASIYELMSPEQ
jgi:uncharacterized protein (TIGR04255 family)